MAQNLKSIELTFKKNQLMYRNAYQIMQSKTYAILGQTAVQTRVNNQPPVNNVTFGYGSGFAIAPGIIVTAKHVLHPNGDVNQPAFQKVLVLRATDIAAGIPPVLATVIGENPTSDIALLRLANPPSQEIVRLSRGLPEIGRSVGSIGFPDTMIAQNGPENRKNINFTFHITFNGSNVSRIMNFNIHGNVVPGFATDGFVYEGGSGGAIFYTDGTVCGMQVGYGKNAKNERQSYTHCLSADQIIDFAVLNGIEGLDIAVNLIPGVEG